MMGRNENDENTVLTGSLQVDNQYPTLEANGTANVTISNVAPAGVGTATISKWLRIELAGTAYYIPLWT